MPEPSEAQVAFLQKQQQLYDLYYRVFSTADGKAVLQDLRMRAFYYKSTFVDKGEVNSAMRAAREGQRNLVLEIEGLIDRGRTGVRPPVAQAISNTARSDSNGA